MLIAPIQPPEFNNIDEQAYWLLTKLMDGQFSYVVITRRTITMGGLGRPSMRSNRKKLLKALQNFGLHFPNVYTHPPQHPQSDIKLEGRWEGKLFIIACPHSISFKSSHDWLDFINQHPEKPPYHKKPKTRVRNAEG